MERLKMSTKETMTTRERFLRMYAHQEADRIPIIDSPWEGTVRRWRKEGMPADMDWRDYFGVDKVETIGVDISPRYPEVVLSENEDSYVATSKWGVTMRHFKEADSTPSFWILKWWMRKAGQNVKPVCWKMPRTESTGNI